MPVEVRDFELMREMGWSWDDLEATPPYVRRVCWDLVMISRAAAAERAERKRTSS
jgi:hypothetical protein